MAAAKKGGPNAGDAANSVPRHPTGEPRKGEPRRRPGRPSLSNEALLDKALDLFLDRGFERTSIDAITAAAGMAKRTLYARYGDKTRLFKAALLRAIDEWIVPVERLRALEDPDLMRTLIAVGDALVANALSPAGQRLMNLTYAESVRMPEISAENLRMGTEPTILYLADLFVRRTTLSHADAELASNAFLNLIVTGPANGAALGTVQDIEAVRCQTRFGVRLFLHGLDGYQEPADQRLQQLITEAGERLDAARERLR